MSRSIFATLLQSQAHCLSRPFYLCVEQNTTENIDGFGPECEPIHTDDISDIDSGLGLGGLAGTAQESRPCVTAPVNKGNIRPLNSIARTEASQECFGYTLKAMSRLIPSLPIGRFHYGWLVLVMGTFAVFGSLGLARFGYSIVLPNMQSDLGLTNTEAGGLATANLVGYLALSIIGGALASRYGARAVITAGLGIAGVGMLLTASANGYVALLLWRALTGVGSGASNVPVLGLLAAWFARRRRGLGTGIGVAGSSLALIFAGPVVPRVLSAYGANGWRVTWAIFGAITLLIAVLGLLVLRNRPSDKGLGPIGDEDQVDQSHDAATGIRWSQVYKAPTVWHLGLVYVAFGFSYIIYMTFFTKALVAEGGYTEEAAGNLFMILGWCSLFCGLIWGTASDKIGRKKALFMVYVTHAIAFSLFALWPVSTGYTISAVLFGLSAWSIPAIMAATCGDMLGPRLAPAALGFITLFFGVGQAASPSIAGAIADATDSFAPAFLLAGGVALLGALGALLLRPTSAPAAD